MHGATACWKGSRPAWASTAMSTPRGRPNGDLRGLVRGINPRGWMADVAYVPSSANRSHGSSLGAKLRAFCDGTRFRYVFS